MGLQRKKLRSEDPEKRAAAERWYRFGVANAGLGIGANTGRLAVMKHDPHFTKGTAVFHAAGHAIGGGVAGYHIGKATQKKLSTRALIGIGTAGHLAGLVGTTYNQHKADQMFRSLGYW